MRNEQDARRARRAFLWAWAAVAAIKLLVAVRLPPFVDEAFYWQEGRHLALAYSDVPGLTAWLARLGTSIAGTNVFGLRWPFLLIGMALPWLVVRISRDRRSAPQAGDRTGEVFAWQAGLLAVLLPLGGSLGLLALPDVPLAFATLLCVDAGVRLLRKVEPAGALELAAGLAIGALSHYRFAAVIGVGLIAFLLIPRGRHVLKDVRTWVALAIGAIAWTPLIVWNLDNADAGLRFQLVDRHPWNFHFDGAWFFVVQALLATPLLFAAMAHAAVRGWHGQGADDRNHAKYFALIGGGTVVAFCLLGFFADNERISFHWTLAGLYALLPLVPATLAQWPRGWRRATWVLAVAGLVAMLGYYVVVSSPAARARFAAAKWYPANFAGWDALADAVRDERAKMPADDAHRRRQLQDRRRTRFRARRSQPRGAAARPQHAPRPRAAAGCVEVARARSRGARRASAAARRRCVRNAVSRVAAALPRAVRHARPVAAAARGEHRPRPPAFRVVPHARQARERRMHDAGDGLHRFAAGEGARVARFRSGGVGVQGRRRHRARGSHAGRRSDRPRRLRPATRGHPRLSGANRTIRNILTSRGPRACAPARCSRACIGSGCA